MTKGKSMMGPDSDKNIESFKINLGAKQEFACCGKVKKYRENVFSGRRVPITQVIITA